MLVATATGCGEADGGGGAGGSPLTQHRAYRLEWTIGTSTLKIPIEA